METGAFFQCLPVLKYGQVSTFLDSPDSCCAGLWVSLFFPPESAMYSHAYAAMFNV
jgi:hypothetical protein